MRERSAGEDMKGWVEDDSPGFPGVGSSPLLVHRKMIDEVYEHDRDEGQDLDRHRHVETIRETDS
jgi:hypothetical protein